MKRPLILCLLLLTLPALSQAAERSLLGTPLRFQASIGVNWYDDWNQSLDPEFEQLKPTYSGALALRLPDLFGAFAVKGQLDLDMKQGDEARRVQVGLYYDF